MIHFLSPLVAGQADPLSMVLFVFSATAFPLMQRPRIGGPPNAFYKDGSPYGIEILQNARMTHGADVFSAGEVAQRGETDRHGGYKYQDVHDIARDFRASAQPLSIYIYNI
jgi:hypothetical protein